MEGYEFNATSFGLNDAYSLAEKATSHIEGIDKRLKAAYHDPYHGDGASNSIRCIYPDIDAYDSYFR